MRTAFGVFVRQPSPVIIAVFLIASAIARIMLGGWGIADINVPFLLFLSFPLPEWLVHVMVLHWRPRKLGVITADLLVARKHREHHNDPGNIPFIWV